MESLDVPSLTLELGDPNIIQEHHVKPAYLGILNAFIKLGFLEELDVNDEVASPFVCEHSQWFYAKHGGILTLFTKLCETVKKGQRIARITNIFGEKVVDINAKFDGIVIGQSTYPVCEEGSRIVHLGRL
jgi:hypothetical protein